MKKITLFTLLSFIILSCKAQLKIENNTKKIKQAQTEITPDLKYFLSDCLVNKDCNECVNELVSKAKNEYQKYLIGGALYNIDSKVSYELHKSAYDKYPNELNFNLEYAIESHRIGDYKTAIKHYEIYNQTKETDYRVHVWLSECYLNLDNYSKAIEHWKKANHSKNHTGIDKAIYIIHGQVDQIKKRSDLISKIKSKDSKSAYELIFLDMNWELDWWNINIQESFLTKDLNTIKNSFGSNSKEYLQLSAYNKIKHLSKNSSSKDAIKTALLDSKLILDNYPMPTNGKIASDLLRISFINRLLDQKEFFEKRGKEMIELADTYKDEELLNIYAYLESVVTGHVSEQTDKKGWNEYKSEKFAISYFIGLANKNKYDNPDLEKALMDFPNSSKIHWVKLNCAKIEGKNIKTDLIEVMKKEFKTLGSSQAKYSYALKNYFYLLENEI
ncbi:hypothetical protein F7018_15745 [Tenacibaculum aiptasiae]|uniref:Tetratricopeptide repeat protein n=1 Tax=Tenacibaculum aiptasiae TaxID=426481 RepID=A0A7J5A933_9FLAO|nr:hypothetical protein [Tenacibaculum aiptasiae]KAB1153938.1 hypothetical protein F7018_15745 [Tenacibaculum aiptasiae]